MIVVGVREAKDKMAQLIDRALAGDEVVITRRGERVARLEALSEEQRMRLRDGQGTGGLRWSGRR